MSRSETTKQPDVIAAIRLWHGIEPPHPSAVEFAKDLHALIAGFRALPAPDFESEPADFVQVLEALAK